MIPIRLEDPDMGPPLERCCFCREATNTWTDLPGRTGGGQVACCPVCASRADEKDVPTKQEWCRREKIAERPTLGEIARRSEKVYPPVVPKPYVRP